mgnify:CR=1 FL=1
MPRILGVDIPNNKKLAYSLRYIYGVGPKRADLVLQETGIDPDMRAKDLNEEQINAIMAKINELNYLVEGCLLYTSPSPRDLSTSRMPSSA